MGMSHRWVEQTGLPGYAGRLVQEQVRSDYLSERAFVLVTSSSVSQDLRRCSPNTAFNIRGLGAIFPGRCTSYVAHLKHL